MKWNTLLRMLMALFTLTVLSCRSTHWEFPSDRSIYLQRTGVTVAGFSSRNVNDVRTLGDNHGLYALNPHQLNFQQILSYGRHLSVFWNRDQTCLAIIDNEGSNRQVLYLYDVKKMALRTIETDALIDLAPDDHFMINFRRWNDDNTVSLKIDVYGSHQYEKEIRCRIPFILDSKDG